MGERRAESPTLGFTVGVYDAFHRGHVAFLKRCLEHCDYLIVGVMTDYWVRVQKGHDRPQDSLAKRMEAVRPLAHKVIAIDVMDMTPYLQISDVWIKCDDQKNMRPENWPCIYLPRTPGISTTQILEKK